MTGQEVIDVAQIALFTFLKMAGPILGVGIAVGVTVAFIQSITQIQEMTLTFVPKILSIFSALLIFLPLMGALISDFFQQLMERVVTGG